MFLISPTMFCIITGFVVVLAPIRSFAYPSTNQVWTFNSRPDLSPPLFDFTILDETLVSPGYILLTPYTPPPDSNLAAGSGNNTNGLTAAEEVALFDEYAKEMVQNGPYIYDQKGNPVWSGFGSTGGSYSHDLKIAEYQGEPHLTFFQGSDEVGGNRGHGVIMDSSYRTVWTVSSGFGRAPNDVHEFSVIDGGSTAITTIFQPTQYDLSAYGVNQTWGWVVQGIFQEIDIQTGEVLFEWRSLDHTDPSESYNSYGSPGTGNGTTLETIWDYFHLNSVDKDNDGNYLVSSRYLCALFKVNGTDGSIIWQLNGKKNQFTFEGFNKTFAFQHHARIREQNETTTVILIFDNGSDGYITPQNCSSGMVMAVDISTMTCTLLKEYVQPNRILTTSQGSTQMLENTNIFMGWGSMPFISEFTADGTCIMSGQFGAAGNGAMSYRAFKANWTGNPDSTPALWSYSRSNSSPTTFYTSWNGATEVASWVFKGSSNPSRCSIVLGTVAKDGFETTFVADKYYAYGCAEALDGDGRSLGVSPIVPTYMPAQNTTFPSSTPPNSRTGNIADIYV